MSSYNTFPISKYDIVVRSPQYLSILQQKILTGLGLRLFHPDLPGCPNGVLVVARLVVVQHVRQGDGSLGLKVKVPETTPILGRYLTVDSVYVLLLLGELLHNGPSRIT